MKQRHIFGEVPSYEQKPGVFRTWKGALGFLTFSVILWVALVFSVASAFGQTATSGSQSAAQAGSAAASQAASLSGVVINQGGVPRTQRIQNDQTYSGNYRVESAPNVSAPAVFGGGHPCLAGKSGGFSVVGGGASFGEGTAEPACMAWIMGNPEIAIRIMMNTSPQFCRAVRNVGYVRIGNSVVPATCGNRVVKGGPETPGVIARPAKVNVSTKSYSQATCERSGGKLRYSVDAHFANKASAKANCKRLLK